MRRLIEELFNPSSAEFLIETPATDLETRDFRLNALVSDPTENIQRLLGSETEINIRDAGTYKISYNLTIKSEVIGGDADITALRSVLTLASVLLKQQVEMQLWIYLQLVRLLQQN